jgi:AcrR family transcriptional regulator
VNPRKPAPIPSQPAERIPLSRDAILAAGLSIARSEDLSRITIRKLSDRFGVTPMAIYRYFENKAEIIDVVVDLFLSEIAIVEGDTSDWREWLRSTCKRWRAALVETPGIIPRLGISFSRGEGGLAATEAVLAVLREAGLSGESAVRGFFALARYTVGTAANEVAWRRAMATAGADTSGHSWRSRAHFASVSPERFPRVVELASHLAEYEGAGPFDDGLDRILDSLAREVAREDGSAKI